MRRKTQRCEIILYNSSLKRKHKGDGEVEAATEQAEANQTTASRWVFNVTYHFAPLGWACLDQLRKEDIEWGKKSKVGSIKVSMWYSKLIHLTIIELCDGKILCWHFHWNHGVKNHLQFYDLGVKNSVMYESWIVQLIDLLFLRISFFSFQLIVTWFHWVVHYL